MLSEQLLDDSKCTDIEKRIPIKTWEKRMDNLQNRLSVGSQTTKGTTITMFIVAGRKMWYC